MYLGEIVNIDNSYFVYVPSVPLKQKVYPVSSSQAIDILDTQDNKIVEVELIPYSVPNTSLKYLILLQADTVFFLC